MPFRVTDTASNTRLINQIATSRQRIATAQEQLASGKRINRPSDDPTGAHVVMQLRTSQAELEQFKTNVETAKDTLLIGDASLDSYQQVLDRVRALMTRAATDPVVNEARVPIAVELDGLIERVRQLANTQHGENYVFGGTRLAAPPYDNTGAPATTPTAEVALQVEPEGTLIATGVTAENIFADAGGNIVELLRTASAAIRGTGDPTADKTTVLATVDRLKDFSNLANIARTRIGERLNHADEVSERLSQYHYSLEESAQQIEAVDIAEAAVKLTESNTALEAILQSASRYGRRSLLDFLG